MSRKRDQEANNIKGSHAGESLKDSCSNLESRDAAINALQSLGNSALRFKESRAFVETKRHEENSKVLEKPHLFLTRPILSYPVEAHRPSPASIAETPNFGMFGEVAALTSPSNLDSKNLHSLEESTPYHLLNNQNLLEHISHNKELQIARLLEEQSKLQQSSFTKKGFGDNFEFVKADPELGVAKYHGSIKDLLKEKNLPVPVVLDYQSFKKLIIPPPSLQGIPPSSAFSKLAVSPH